MKQIIFIMLCICSFNSIAEDAMNQLNMEKIIKEMAEHSKGEKGMVEFKYQGMDMYLISDVNHDRMRIITPIADYINLTAAQITKTMESNFHSALDARYAVSNGVLFAAYIHPLSKLDLEQIQSAVNQVFNLKATFGSGYTSNALAYGGNE